MKIYAGAYNQLKKDVGLLMSYLNVEDKYVDNSASGSSLSASWQIAHLSGIAQGTTSSTRSGQSVKLVGFEFRYTLNIANANSCAARIVVVIDKQANAAAPTFTNVYPVGVTAPRTVAYLSRFTILFEDVITLSTNGQEYYCGVHTIPLNSHIMFNSGNAGDVTDIVTNSIYLGYISDTTTNFPTITWNARVIFVDN